ncbi:MAG: hydrogenase maturation nickel metallochaperone HypA [Leptolyngbyaceae cyanobacterium MO_188.B28]|nr:hydrogenase maturation nickel metallochaperone HypA [Leptolyngbyaceae cyanobacterium MO_188.B28]
MHELKITQNVVATISKRAKGAKVQRVLLEIGKLSGIMPEAVRYCFDVCSQGTVAEGAILAIQEIPGLARCSKCGAEIPLDKPLGVCEECGSVELVMIRGQDLKVKEIEMG